MSNDNVSCGQHAQSPVVQEPEGWILPPIVLILLAIAGLGTVGTVGALIVRDKMGATNVTKTLALPTPPLKEIVQEVAITAEETTASLPTKQKIKPVLPVEAPVAIEKIVPVVVPRPIKQKPIIAAPNDKLPDNFIPGQNIQPLTAAAGTPLAVDQFFEDNLDLTLGTKNYTQEYRGTYPEDQRTPDTLVAFAKSQPITTKLPTLASESIKLQPTDTPLVLAAYLDIAGNLGVFSNRTVLATAINDVYGKGNTDIMAGLANSVRAHQQRVATLRVPPTAVSLQRLLLGYTELLAVTYDEITSYNEDPVKAVVALYRLEVIDKQYYPLIESEVDRLHQYQQTLGGQ